MVANSTNKDGVRRIVIHTPIPVVDVIVSQMTLLGFVATSYSLATPEAPPTILMTIAMVTLHSCHHMVDWTPEVEGLVPVIHVSCPNATG